MAITPHYGGSLTKAGVGRRPRANTNFRTELILEKLVRFDIAKAMGTALLTDADIARVLGKSTRMIDRMRKRLSYLRKRMEITTGISADSDNFVADVTARHKVYLKQMMPDAIRAFADSLQFKPTTLAEKKFKFDVAREILDREGSFPKISRTDIHQKVEHDFASIDGVSKELLESIEGAAQSSEEDFTLTEALAANKKFAKSDVLGAEKQQDAIKALETMSVNTDMVN